MTITDNGDYIKWTTIGLLNLLMAQSAASAESKFLSLQSQGYVQPDSFTHVALHSACCGSRWDRRKAR